MPSPGHRPATVSVGMSTLYTPKDILLDTIQAIREHPPVTGKQQEEGLPEPIAKFMRGMIRGLIVATYDVCHGNDITVSTMFRKHVTQVLTIDAICDEAEAVIRDLWPPVDPPGHGGLYKDPINFGNGEMFAVYEINRLLGQFREAVVMLGGLQQPYMSTEEVTPSMEMERSRGERRHLALLRSIVIALGGNDILKEPSHPMWLTAVASKDVRPDIVRKLIACGASVNAADGASVRWFGPWGLKDIVDTWDGVRMTESYIEPEFSRP